PVERLLAGEIACRQQRSRLSIPQGEREHPAQAREKPFAPVLVRVYEHFDIRAAAERMTVRLELGAQGGKVIDLAIGDELNRVRLVAERLLPARQIDDRQPPHAET